MKRIAVFCDGTWNSADQAHNGVACPTNVVKLALRVKPHHAGVTQVTFYGEGVGNGNVLDRFAGGAFGQGLNDNLFAAYRFLMHNYERGDELYVFGFSRGAFTARSLVGMIRKCGILRRQEAEHYRAAVALYQNEEHPESKGPTEFRKRYSAVGDEQIPIQFIGVWDTVGALGVPLVGGTANKYKFHDVQLSGTVLNAYQALAIEEQRAPFEAARWAYKKKDGQKVEQVWFAGVHSDVGGGYSPDDPPDGWGLSDTALDWLSNKATDTGLGLDEPAFTMQPNYLAKEHKSMTWFYALMPRNIRAIGLAATAREQPNASTKEHDPTQAVHPSVLQRWDALPAFRPQNLRDYLVRIGDPRGSGK